jgi:replication initiation protein RepC
MALQRLRERFTICRRDVGKLIAAAIEAGAEGDWEAQHLRYRAIVEGLSRSPTGEQLAACLGDMERLRDAIVNVLEMQINSQNHSGNDVQTERHIQNSNSESISESEPAIETPQDAGRVPDRPPSDAPRRNTVDRTETFSDTGRVVDARGNLGRRAPAVRPFPLGMVLRACPQIVDYGPGGQIGSWRDLMATAVVVRTMLGVSPSAYQEACEVMGPESASAVIACILERAGHINSAGGYLRDLTRRAERDEFSIGPMLMALARPQTSPQRAVS